jgi:CheY-like chemotaxis protein
MPVMDGYEATIAIRNGEVGVENATIPIIAVTADVMESTKSRTAERNEPLFIAEKKKCYMIYERASLTVAQPYKDVFNFF